MVDVPIIDLLKNEEELIVDLHRACKDCGFFYVINHGISEERFGEILDACRKFFSLPLDEKEKMNAKNSPQFRGYIPFQEEKLDPTQLQGDTKEGFYIGPGIIDGQEPDRFYGPNQWPNSSILPGWKETMEEYLNECTHVGMKLLKLLGKSISLCANDKDKQIPYDFIQHFTNPNTVVRLNHYCSTKSNPEEGIFSCGAHTDYGMITLLLTDDVPALQIYPLAGKNNNISPTSDGWINVTPKSNAFIVNLGDLMQYWSNDNYKSTLHRVINLTNKERYSIPFFFEPNPNTIVTPLSCCSSEENTKQIESITFGQYLLNKYSNSHSDFK